MSEQSRGGQSDNPFKNFSITSIEEMFYPAPKERAENPEPTTLHPGDLVGILVGPATGGMGVVLVERNGNYLDKEPYCSDESIGVQVVQPMDINDDLLARLADMGVPTHTDATLERAIRWFDGPEQLELLYHQELDQ